MIKVNWLANFHNTVGAPYSIILIIYNIMSFVKV
jgi:hypothetical protein